MKLQLASLIVVLAALPAAAQPDGGVAAPSTPAPASEDVDIARAHFNTGQAYYEHGRFADAAREFEEAYRLSQKPALLYNMGKAYDGGSDFARALDAYQRFLDAASEEAPDRAFAEKRVELLKTLVGKITLDGAVDGSDVKLDGNGAGFTPLPAALIVNPGRHQLEIQHEDYSTFRTTVDVRVGGATRVQVKQTEKIKVVTVTQPQNAPEKPFYKNWWLWAGLGGVVVVAGVITAVVLTTSTSSGTPSLMLPQVR